MNVKVLGEKKAPLGNLAAQSQRRGSNLWRGLHREDEILEKVLLKSSLPIGC